jgi:hypothetical protein
LHGVAYGLVGAVTNAWPAVGFILASEILMGMFRRARSTRQAPEPTWTVAADVPGTATIPAPVPATEAVADAPVYIPLSASEETVSDAPGTVAATASEPVVKPASGRTSKRATGRTKARASSLTPETRYADMLAAGQMPSMRQVQREMKVGAPRARQVLEQLTAITNSDTRKEVPANA